MTFIKEKRSHLEVSHKTLLSELNDLETKWSRLEEMIKEDSHKLMGDGQAILDQAKQIKDSYADFNDKYDISIKVVQGYSWDPSKAALLQMNDETEIEPEAKRHKTSIGSSMSKITSKLFANEVVTGKDDTTGGNPICVRYIVDKFRVGLQNRLEIFDTDLKLITKLSNTDWGNVNDIACVPDNDMVLVCTRGLFHVDSIGNVISIIGSGNYKSGVYHNGTLYVYEDDSASIQTYKYNDSWERQRTIQSPFSKGQNTLSISDTTITVCGVFAQSLCILNHEGQQINSYGKPSKRSKSAGRLNCPRLCQEDGDGVLLVADSWNNRLQILDERRK